MKSTPLFAVFILLFAARTVLAQYNGSIVAWGYNNYGQCSVPAPNSDFVAVAGGYEHSVGLKADGSIVAWGRNQYGQCDVPEPNTGFVAVDAGYYHGLGLKEDGSIVAWGNNWHGQCDVPEPNEGFVAVAAGAYHNLGLKADGSIVAWGYNSSGQCDVPEPNTGFVAVSGGGGHSLGLKEDGSIVAWGSNTYGQCDLPEPNTGFVEVSAGWIYNLALKEDGSIVAWGSNGYGQCDVPEPNTGFVEVSAGWHHSLALKEDDSIVAWGYNLHGQCNVPAPNIGFYAIAAGGNHSFGLHPITEVTEPDGSTVWTHFQTELPVVWGGFLGGTIDILLYNGAELVDTLITVVGNTGSWVFEGPVPMTWAPGEEYRIHIEDTRGNWAFSEYFTIEPSQGANVITVVYPDESTVWTHFDTDLPMDWNYPTGRNLFGLQMPLSGDEASIHLYDGDDLVATLADGEENTGSWMFEGPVPMSWTPGEEYRIQIQDNLGNYGWSQFFTVEPSEGAEVITVTQPYSETVWPHFDTDLPVEWSFPARGHTTGYEQPVSGDKVSLILFIGIEPVATLASAIDNTGYFEYPGPVPMSWTPGDDYRIYILDTFGNYGWSEYFTVEPSEGAEVITVTEPDSETVWSNDEIDRPVTWSYPALLCLDEPLSGETVSVLLYRDEAFIDTLVTSAPNTGSWAYTDSIPDTWESGTDYLLMVVDDLGNYGWSSEFSIENPLGITPPESVIRLFPVTPNPVSGIFTILYHIPALTHASVGVYDLSGRLVYPLAEGEHASGLHQLQMGGLPSGIYFCRLTSGGVALTERFVVIR